MAAVAYSATLNQIYSTAVTTSLTALNVASSAQNGILTIYYEKSNTYTSGTHSNLILKKDISIAGTPGTEATVIRSLGLASKAFLMNGVSYVLGVYGNAYQSTYFLVNSSGEIRAKLAYSNGGRYLTLGLPSATIPDGDVAYIAYRFNELLIPVDKNQGTNGSQVYAQTGLNLASFDFSDVAIITSEIGQNLNISGGFLRAFDGNAVVESGFHLYPDDVTVATSTSGGHIADAVYYYQVIYQWTDAQGNISSSAPSIPVAVTASGGGNSTNTITVPTLRVTAKTANPVKIVVFRSSVAQPIYYQVTSFANPTYNSTSADSVDV
ncbi:MAG: hypothetical protein V4440_08635, partial [Pseudomonadota bacterium]